MTVAGDGVGSERSSLNFPLEQVAILGFRPLEAARHRQRVAAELPFASRDRLHLSVRAIPDGE